MVLSYLRWGSGMATADNDQPWFLRHPWAFLSGWQWEDGDKTWSATTIGSTQASQSIQEISQNVQEVSLWQCTGDLYIL